MTPEERQLIAGLFDRMRGFHLAEKDGEAEALIGAQVGSVRDAPYMLVQSVLVQEQALQQAQSRIEALEEQVRSLQSGAPQRPSGSGSFLGGFLGGRSAAEPGRGASVPTVGTRATPSLYGSPQASTPPQAAPPSAAAPQPGGGGFLQSAMATAAGVAGGMLAASAIGSLLGGSGAHAASAQTTPDAASHGGGTTEAAQQASDTGSTDAHPGGWQDTTDDDGGWSGGDDGGGFDDFDV